MLKLTTMHQARQQRKDQGAIEPYKINNRRITDLERSVAKTIKTNKIVGGSNKSGQTCSGPITAALYIRNNRGMSSLVPNDVEIYLNYVMKQSLRHADWC